MNTTTTLPPIGSIFECSWGYDQTNIDYFQVVGLTPKSVIIQKIGKQAHDAEKATVVPVKDSFTGTKMVKRIGKYGSFRVNSYSHAFLWDGKPSYETPFGQGH